MLREAQMKVELLYFEGCPNTETTRRALRRALAEEGIEAEIHSIRVEKEEEARRLRFPGSPTIRIDGADAFPVPEERGGAPACRTYATPEGLRGAPTAEMLRSALAAIRYGPARDS
jgi:glutaredoxin